MCLAQGHNTVMPLRLQPVQPATPRSRVKHSTTALPLIGIYHENKGGIERGLCEYLKCLGPEDIILFYAQLN